MKREISLFVEKCIICQQVKAKHQKPSGPLNPLEIPEWKWEKIAMDFVVGFLKSMEGHDAIWVIVDRLTKFAHFLPIRMNCSMDQFAQLYVKEIVRLHGIPTSIVSDRDPRFTSKFWKSMQGAMGTTLNFSTAYHPQSDGQSERTIQILEDMLRACVLDLGGSWESHLSLVEFAYNNSFQTTIGMAPYEALYGRRLAPIKGVLRFGKKGKLRPRFIGPFEILDRIGNVAYRLALPPRLSVVHNVFHVSMLRKYVHDSEHVISYDSLEVQKHLTYEETPLEIVERKTHALRNKEIALVKVQWKNHGVEGATWEKEEEIKAKLDRVVWTRRRLIERCLRGHHLEFYEMIINERLERNMLCMLLYMKTMVRIYQTTRKATAYRAALNRRSIIQSYENFVTDPTRPLVEHVQDIYEKCMAAVEAGLEITRILRL
ncbi:uncharacterized protein LOC111370016 [Olea europaea var. sylvestris]|uniref:uncharacterized protein LOC111370016 n=1 Tax=Olea europaea var. sylvestris TaxID=158386 RepID=UPI000C1D0EB5|nr:uncharacterized protein LOC111370016 [Olea europaea var. sylvestris]